MVVGVGIDLVEHGRVERALGRWGERFVAKLMDPDEASRLPAGAGRSRALAVAIAGKEAASKAIGTGWSRGVRWRDVIVEVGPPVSVGLRGAAARAARALGSEGATRLQLEQRGDLIVAEVWLISSAS
jgi:holo-[acyl-carrier protein] synthase